MAVQADTSGQPATASQRWYARSPDEVAGALGVDPASGLSSARAAELLRADGPNALPEEKPTPGGGGSWTSIVATCSSSW